MKGAKMDSERATTEATTGQITSDDQSAADAGRAVVREVLVNRLRDAGLRRAKGASEADHARTMDHLCDYLSYMSRDNLVTLAETVLIHATQPGAQAGVWPSEVLVRQWALALQAKPFSQHPIVASWLRSVEGPIAEAGGYLVELLRWLRRHRRALTPADLAQVKREAADMQASLSRVRERIAKGVPWPDDHDTLSAWLRDEHEARQYVDEGHGRRALRATGDERAA